MNVKLRVLSAGVLFFIGQVSFAQVVKKDSTKETKIEEVVVLGYSKTATRAKSTAASTTISSATLENRPNVSFLNSLQGAAPGISINSASGSPGSGKIDVRVRGVGSLNSSIDPLYVIDGMITNGTQFRNLNPNDIETISVLRDAIATSIYGNRGANGVVVITTKSGTFNSGFKLSYDATTGFSTFPNHKYNLASSNQLLNLQAAYGAGMGAEMTQEEINAYNVNTNWNDVFFKTGMTQQHNVGMTFGGKNVSVFTSIGYLENEGTVKSTDFKRFTFRNNINGKSDNGRFKYGSQLAIGYSKRHQLDQENNTANLVANPLQNPLFSQILSPATLPVGQFANGQELFNQIGTDFNGRTAWVTQDIINGGIVNQFSETSIFASANASYKLTDELTVGNKTGVDYKESDREFARAPLGYLSIASKPTGAAYGGSETLNNIKDFSFGSITNLTFNKSFGDHNLEVGAYLDYQKVHYITKQYTQNGLNPLTWSLGAGTGYIPFSSATPSLYVPIVQAQKLNAGTLAYFATVDYDYAGKYGFGGLVRRDGSYRFKKDNRWETFWAVSGRWNIDKESFMENSPFSLLKLRASYGTQGNQSLGTGVNNLNPLVILPNKFRDLNNTTTGYLNQPGINASVIGNPDIQWEKQSQFNAGLDFAVFNRKLEGNFDYYIKTTNSLFNQLRSSAVTSFYSYDGNNGKMENRGVEAILRYNILNKNDFKISIFANGSYNRNKIIELPYGYDQSADYVNAAGSLAFQWNLVKYKGVNSETGEMQFYAQDGSITEAPTSADRVLTGKSFYAKYQGGFGLNAAAKGFFVDVLFSWQAGGWSYDNLYAWLMDPSYMISNNVSADLLGSWTPDNTGASLPSLLANNTGTDGSSDRFLYKTDFIRLKNASIGYSFSKEQLGNLPISSFKIFVQGENIHTWSKWKGFDPEPVSDYSLSVYPNPKTFSVGFNVEF